MIIGLVSILLCLLVIVILLVLILIKRVSEPLILRGCALPGIPKLKELLPANEKVKRKQRKVKVTQIKVIEHLL